MYMSYSVPSHCVNVEKHKENLFFRHLKVRLPSTVKGTVSRRNVESVMVSVFRKNTLVFEMFSFESTENKNKFPISPSPVTKLENISRRTNDRTTYMSYSVPSHCVNVEKHKENLYSCHLKA
ncbi:unnamed protein product [Owenia fusiformis]|uniref:Uncharacterized protein n=1 Tax=Owenia fusiformis TaxID=6347 RepID=A0A8S4NSI5_OWEFU|nr:unnamed protein product [Owenia fusiformis]